MNHTLLVCWIVFTMLFLGVMWPPKSQYWGKGVPHFISFWIVYIVLTSILSAIAVLALALFIKLASLV